VRSLSVVLALVLTGCAQPALESRGASSAGPSAQLGSAAEISRDEAVGRARDALREASQSWSVVLAEAGPLEEVRPGWEAYDWGRSLAGSVRVWRVVMSADGLSAEVLIDASAGAVYGSVIGVAD
jgi:hypothetical protein